MLQELSIKDFAIISDLNIEFEDKMNALTGETGAGKSIIIDAVGLLIGGRSSVEYIRNGCNKALLQGLFLIKNSQSNVFRFLDDLGIDYEDNQILIDRELNVNGRNVCRINGTLVNISTLKKLGAMMVDIHGQNEHQQLMNIKNHLGMLDNYDQSIQSVLVDYQKSYAQYIDLKQKLIQKQEHFQEFAQRLDILKFQIDEIESAQLQVNEEEELLHEKEYLNNYQQISEAIQNSLTSLNNDDLQGDSAVDQIGTALNELQSISDINDNYAKLSESLSNVYYELQDIVDQLTDEISTQDYDEGRLNEVEERLNLIHQLKRKYGSSIKEILDYLEKIKKELADMEELQDNDDQLEKRLTIVEDELSKKAAILSEKRKQIAEVLTNDVNEQLHQLCMEKAKFKVVFHENDIFSVDGLDKIEFYVQTNVGEGLKPLVKIASGGELSRIMLALKTVFAKQQNITSIIFDEIDTGVSGRVAQAIANKIKAIADYSQVLCITHLPQVAATAETQFYIEKQVHNNRTETTVTKLTENERITKIATMLSGDKITDASIEQAKALLMKN